MIAHLKLQIARLRREQYGPSAERSRRLLEQMGLQLEELEADASEDDLVVETLAAKVTGVTSFERKRPVRNPFPEHLPRERVVIAAPCSCPEFSGSRLSRLGEDVTETLEVIPRAWKVIQTVREKVWRRASSRTGGRVSTKAARRPSSGPRGGLPVAAFRSTTRSISSTVARCTAPNWCFGQVRKRGRRWLSRRRGSARGSSRGRT